MDLEAFELVLLRRPASAPDYPEAELDRVQREHLAHHARHDEPARPPRHAGIAPDMGSTGGGARDQAALLLLYLGRATSLRSRVASYWGDLRGTAARSPRSGSGSATTPATRA